LASVSSHYFNRFRRPPIIAIIDSTSHHQPYCIPLQFPFVPFYASYSFVHSPGPRQHRLLHHQYHKHRIPPHQNHDKLGARGANTGTSGQCR
jgi:hypothetical protein